MFAINNLNKTFVDGKTKLDVLKNININIKKGEKIAIIGPSGSGKSTLLRCLNGLEAPSSGNVFFEGADINSSEKHLNSVRKRVGMVFQKFNLFPNLTVFENIMLSPKINYPKEIKKYEKKSLELLKRIGLLNKKDTYPFNLSGGQQQRIAIVRSLVMNPEVLLFDEPTSALDPEMILEVLLLIEDLANTGLTMVIVTHELSFAKKVANRILFMADGEILEDTSSQEFFKSPTTSRAQDFLNKLSYNI